MYLLYVLVLTYSTLLVRVCDIFGYSSANLLFQHFIYMIDRNVYSTLLIYECVIHNIVCIQATPIKPILGDFNFE